MEGDAAIRRIATALRDMDPTSVPHVDPPADLWDRIEQSLAATARSRPLGAGSVVEYRIDEHDVVVGTGSGWVEFAEVNEAPELAEGVIGRSLWDSMEEGPLQDLWRAAVAGVRASGRVATVPFRCDGPEARRWYEMALTPAPDGSVGFRSRLVFEMDRPEVGMLRRRLPADGGAPIEICCWCAAARDGAVWQPIEVVLSSSRLLEGAPGSVTHGFCERCARVAHAELLADHQGPLEHTGGTR